MQFGVYLRCVVSQRYDDIAINKFKSVVYLFLLCCLSGVVRWLSCFIVGAVFWVASQK